MDEEEEHQCQNTNKEALLASPTLKRPWLASTHFPPALREVVWTNGEAAGLKIKT